MLCVGTRVTTRGSSDSENSVSNPVNDGEASQIRIRRKKKKKKRGKEKGGIPHWNSRKPLISPWIQLQYLSYGSITVVVYPIYLLQPYILTK